MRVKTLMLAACCALALPAASTAADWHMPQLDQAASLVSGHATPVWCSDSEADWVYVQQVYGGGFRGYSDNLLGFTRPTIDAWVFINPRACLAFHLAYQAGIHDAGLYWLAGAMLTLIHESIHQRGVSDEAQTECAAITAFAGDATSVFGVPRFVTVKVLKRIHGRLRLVPRQVPNPDLARLVAWAHVWHAMTPPAYRTVC
jgi:hypothetical protein